jgi:hypothetical protein
VQLRLGGHKRCAPQGRGGRYLYLISEEAEMFICKIIIYIVWLILHKFGKKSGFEKSIRTLEIFGVKITTVSRKPVDFEVEIPFERPWLIRPDGISQLPF